MRGSAGAALLIGAMMHAVMSAQSPAATETQRPEAAVSYSELFKVQADQYQNALEMQRRMSESAIDALVQGQQLLQTVIAIGGLTFTALTFAGGWYFRRELKKFEEVSNKCDVLSSTIDGKVAELGKRGTSFESEVRRLEALIVPLDERVRGCVQALDGLKASLSAIEHDGPLHERLDDVMLKARLAELRIVLLSGGEQEKVRAAQALSEIARAPRGAVAIPVLLDTIGRADTPAAVVAEALYGLGSRTRELAGDAHAEDLIIQASKSIHDSVRLLAVETMGRHDPMPVRYQTRLQECANADTNGEVRAAAKRNMQSAV